MVDGSAIRAGANASHWSTLLLRAKVQSRQRSVPFRRDGVVLDNRERGRTVRVPCPSTLADKVSPLAAVNVADPIACDVRRSITVVTCSVKLPRKVALPVPSRVIERNGKTVVPVSTALTFPLNGVLAATALAVTIAGNRESSNQPDEQRVTNLQPSPLWKWSTVMIKQRSTVTTFDTKNKQRVGTAGRRRRAPLPRRGCPASAQAPNGKRETHATVVVRI